MRKVIPISKRLQHSAWATLVALIQLSTSSLAQNDLTQDNLKQENLVQTKAGEQSTQGALAYTQHCAGCHGVELQGGPFGPSLKGSTFKSRWGGTSLEELFNYIRASMPPAAVGQLDPSTLLAILSHQMQMNGAEWRETPLAMASLAERSVPGQAMSQQDAIRANAFMRNTPGVKMPDWPTAPNPLEKISPVTEDLLRDPPPQSWLSWRRGYGGQGFSPLKQINNINVDDLRIAWSLTLPAGPNTTEPLFHEGVLFIYSHGDKVFALNGASGDELWRYERRLPENQRLDTKRTMALWDNKLFICTADAHIVALDIKTGRALWDRAIAEPGWRTTGGPLVANGVVMQGLIGGDKPGGGYIAALDAGSGEELWRFHAIARPGEHGGNSWNGLPLEQRSGGSLWTSGTYDAELDLAFFGPGPTYDTGPLRFLSDQPGVTNDALYTDSTLAIRPRTGELVWYFQHMRNDQWDMDWAFERVLYQADVDGEQRKVLVTSGKEGWFDILDAATGKYVDSFEMGIQNFIKGIDPETGIKTIDQDLLPGGLDHDILICPWGGGGRNWMPTSFDDSRRVLYGVAVEACMNMAPLPPGETGFLTTNVDVTISPFPGSDGRFGRLQAMNVDTGKTEWLSRRRAPPTTGVLATAGDVVFNGGLDRHFMAFDADDGEMLWDTILPDVPNGSPITYAVDNKQYVALVIGYGNPTTVTWPGIVPEITLPSVRSSAVFVFALPED